jgi:hypothetical protein
MAVLDQPPKSIFEERGHSESKPLPVEEQDVQPTVPQFREGGEFRDGRFIGTQNRDPNDSAGMAKL